MSEASAADQRWIGWWALGLATILVVWAWSRVHPPLVPAARDPATAVPWMADALPGIGAKRRDAAAQAIRQRHWSALPASAQAPAQSCFGMGSAVEEEPSAADTAPAMAERSSPEEAR